MTRLSRVVFVALAGTLALRAGLVFGAESANAPAQPKVVKLITTSEEIARMWGGWGRGPGGGGPGGGGPGGGGPGRGGDPNAPGYVVVVSADGGKPVRLNVSAEYKRRLGSLGQDKGELVVLTMSGEEVSGVARFEGPRELKQPNIYLFQGMGEKPIGGQNRATIKLQRFGPVIEAVVPTRASVEGFAPQPDEKIIALAKAMKSGDLAQAEFAVGTSATKNLPMLTDFSAPRKLLFGDFSKMTSAKDSAGKPMPAIVIENDGNAETIAMPVGTGAAATPRGIAINTMARRLKVGYGVAYSTITEDGPATLRDLQVDGSVEPLGEKFLQVKSTYVKIDLIETRFDRDGMMVNYHPGAARPEEQAFSRGIARALESDDQIKKLNLTPAQVKSLTLAADTLQKRRDDKPTATEKSQWTAAYHTWFNSAGDAARLKVEQEMILAAQELSLRLRKDIQFSLFLAKNALDAEQLKQVRELGREENRFGPPGFGPSRNRGGGGNRGGGPGGGNQPGGQN